MASRILLLEQTEFFGKILRANLFRHAKLSRRHKSYWHTVGTRPLLAKTKYDALRHSAEANGDKPAVVSHHQRLEVNYSSFKNDVDSLAAGLANLNYPVGTTIGILAPNIYEWMVMQYATAKLGWVLTNLNPAIQAPELEYALNLARCTALVISDEFTVQNFHKMLQILEPDLQHMAANRFSSLKLPHLKTIINIGSARLGGCIRYCDIVSAATPSLIRTTDEINSKLDVDSVVSVQLTSGTTGKPKAVPLTHHNIVNNAYTLGYWSGIAQDPNAAICLNVPLIHCFGCVIGSLNSVIHGAKIVLPAPRFNAKAALDAISKHKCTIVYGTPTMYVDMLNQMTSEHSMKSLHSALMSGAPCPPSLREKVAQQMGVNTMHVAYGSTEMSPVCTFTLPDSLSQRADTVGKPMDHIEVKIVDKRGDIVPFGERGELCSRGYHVFKGYLHEPERTAEILVDGWYHSGDEATMYDDGLISITGRIKDMIIRGGENIYPTEIENFLLNMPGVEEVNVCGVPDLRLGEEICAWIRIVQDFSLTEDDVKQFCYGKLSHFKVPRYIVFVKEFPKTVSGKIQKFAMREEMCRRLRIENKL